MNAADQWSLSGRLYFEMNQIYTDPTFHIAHEYRIETDVTVMGGDPLQPDVMDISGIVLTGASTVPSLSPGATVSGSLWEDPVTLTRGHTGYNTGYELNLNEAADCADAAPGNASIVSMLVGGGGTSATSLLGSTATGLTFSEGR